MTYTIQEGTLALQPNDDRTVNILTLEQEGGTPLHLVVSRDALLNGEDLAGSVSRQVKATARHVQGFKEISRVERAVGARELPAVLLQTQFKQNGQAVHQCQAVLELAEGKLLVFTLNSVSPFSASQLAQWGEIVDGFVPAEPVADESEPADAPRAADTAA